jgi:DNA-binding transcriptional ArsR family regulator
MNIDNQLMKEAHALLHPTRYKIAALLSESPMSIKELTEALGKEKRLISYHLFILEEHGFVNGEFKVSKKANLKELTAKQYGVTEKGRLSYNLIILDEEKRIEGGEHNPFKEPELKQEMVRKYRATEKVDGVLYELKKSL